MQRHADDLPPAPAQSHKVRVRPAAGADGEIVAAMIAALSAEDGAEPPAFTADHFRRQGLGPGRLFEPLIAELDGSPVGVALLTRGYDSQIAAGGVILEDLYVEPLARRRGAATALLAECARIAAAEGRRWIAWHVRRENVRAQLFYRSIGAAAETVDTMALTGDALDRLARRATEA